MGATRGALAPRRPGTLAPGAATDAMIDTVRFRVTHPEVHVGSPIHEEIVTRTGRNIALLAKGTDGAAVGLYGGLLHRDSLVSVSASKTGVYVTTSLARAPERPEAPNVFAPRSAEECSARMAGVERHLEHLGLSVDLGEAGLSRVDLCRDAVLDAPYGDYLLGLQARDFQRLSPVDVKRLGPFDSRIPKASRLGLDAHTYGRTSTNRAVVTYCKTAHIQSGRSHRSYAEAVLEGTGGAHIVRFEGRYLQGRGVRSGLGIDTGGHLVSCWDHLTDKYDELVTDSLGCSGDAPHAAEELDQQAGAGGDGAAITTRFAAIVERHGRGTKAVLMDLALKGLEAQVARGDAGDLEHARAVYSAAGVRKRDVDGLLGDLMALLDVSGKGTIETALEGVRGELLAGGFEWPEFSG